DGIRISTPSPSLRTPSRGGPRPDLPPVLSNRRRAAGSPGGTRARRSPRPARIGNWREGWCRRVQASELLLEPLAHRLDDPDAREELVVRRDEDPGGGLGARPGDHVVHGGLVGVPFVAVAPVLVRDLVALEPRI